MTVILKLFNGSAAIEFKEGETVGELIQRFKDENQIRFQPNTFSVLDTRTGRSVDDSEIVMDGRSYYLSAWIRERVDTV